MKPSELYDATLSMVCELTGLAPDAVLQSKTEECTDARCTLVGCLAHYLTDTQMASLMGLYSVPTSVPTAVDSTPSPCG